MRLTIGCLALCLSMSSLAGAESSYLARTRAALATTGQEMPAITAAADAAAAALASGGKFWAGGHPALISEFAGRAGGLMLLKPLQPDQAAPGDAVVYAAGDLDRTEELAALAAKGLTLICIGGNAPAGAFTLSATTDSGLSPTLAGAATGWVYLAETIAALTRQGKMPVVYETIGLYGGFQRIAQYDAQGIFWHETHTVPPIPPGVLGAQYISALTEFLDRVEREMSPRLMKTAAWTAAARAAGKRTILYSMGHMFPNEVADTEIGTLFESGVWNSGFSQIAPPEDTYAAGDVIVHIGYQHPPYRLLPKVRQAGARIAYVDILQHRDFPSSEDCLWIDPMWPWADGVVVIPNYDVPACPASGVVNAAIAWEIYRLSREAMGG